MALNSSKATALLIRQKPASFQKDKKEIVLCATKDSQFLDPISA